MPASKPGVAPRTGARPANGKRRSGGTDLVERVGELAQQAPATGRRVVRTGRNLVVTAKGYNYKDVGKKVVKIAERIRPVAKAQPGATVAINEIAEEFVALVSDLPQVRQVLLEGVAPEQRICTVIEAPTVADEDRAPIYGAQVQVRQNHPEAQLEFRLVNSTRNRTRDFGEKLPEGVQLLYPR